MKQENLNDRYTLAKEIGFDNGYGIGQDNALDYDPTDYEKYSCDCAEIESDHFRQFSPFEFTAQEFNRPVEFFDTDGNMVKEENRPWVNDKIWDGYEAGVRKGIDRAWKEAQLVRVLGAPA